MIPKPSKPPTAPLLIGKPGRPRKGTKAINPPRVRKNPLPPPAFHVLRPPDTDVKRSRPQAEAFRRKTEALAHIDVLIGLHAEATRPGRSSPASRVRAWELLGKHLGMFKQQVEVSGPNGAPIETKDANPIDVARRIAFLLTAAAPKEPGE